MNIICQDIKPCRNLWG